MRTADNCASCETMSRCPIPGLVVRVRVRLSGTDDGSVRFWRLETGAGESIKAHENTVSALASFRDRQGSLVLASGGFEGAIVVWKADIKDGLRRDMVRSCEEGTC